MKRLMNNILIAGALLIGAKGLIAGQASENFVDQLFKAKLGITHFAEPRQPVEQATVKPATTWLADFHKAKHGMSVANEESSFREEAFSTGVAPANTWHRDHCTAKFGRDYPGYMGK